MQAKTNAAEAAKAVTDLAATRQEAQELSDKLGAAEHETNEARQVLLITTAVCASSFSCCAHGAHVTECSQQARRNRAEASNGRAECFRFGAASRS